MENLFEREIVLGYSKDTVNETWYKVVMRMPWEFVHQICNESDVDMNLLLSSEVLSRKGFTCTDLIDFRTYYLSSNGANQFINFLGHFFEEMQAKYREQEHYPSVAFRSLGNHCFVVADYFEKCFGEESQ